MTATFTPDLGVLTGEMLEELASRPPVSNGLAEDIEELRKAGYFLSAVPVEFGGLGGSLHEVCEQQRRLARSAPAVAAASCVHLAWTGTAADRYRSGDMSLTSLLEQAAGGAIFCSATPTECTIAETGYLEWAERLLAAVIQGMADGVFR
jgi:alkylation response protein AidB-like acyl-CoA dehydrogenase